MGLLSGLTACLVLGSSESFQQLPPIRIIEPNDGDLGHRINKIIQRASAATGLEVVVTDNEIMKAIKADPETAMNTEYTINTSMPQHLSDGYVYCLNLVFQIIINCQGWKDSGSQANRVHRRQART